MTDWYEDQFDSDYEGDLEELVATVAEGRRYGIPGKGDFQKALAQQQLGKGAIFDVDNTDTGQELIRLQMPQQYSRDWTVSWNVSRSRREVRAGVFENVREGIGQDSFLAIRWGSGGAQNEVEIDVRSGGYVTLYGSFVEVVAFADVQEQGGSTNPGGTISATIAPGSPPGGKNELTRTVFIGDVGGVGPPLIVTSAVPSRAIRVNHFFSGDATQPRKLSFFSLGFTTLAGEYNFLKKGDRDVMGYDSEGVLVPPGAELVDYQQVGGAFTNVMLVYTLAL